METLLRVQDSPVPAQIVLGDFGSIAILCGRDEIGAYTLGFLSRIADFQPKQQSKGVISRATDVLVCPSSS